MQNDNDKIKKLTGPVLSQFEAEPPADMWSRIEWQTRRNKRIVLFRYLAMAASVLILMGVGFSLLVTDEKPDFRSESKPAVNQNEVKDAVNSPVAKAESLHKSVIQPSFVVKSSNNNSSNQRYVPVSIQRADQKLAQSGEPRFTTELSQKNEDTSPGEKLLATESNLNGFAADSAAFAEVTPAPVVISNLNPPDIPESVTVKPPVKDERGNSNWQLALGYGTSAAIEMSGKESALNSPKSNYSHDGLTAEVANETSYFEEIKNVSHDAPLSFGFMISKQFYHRWYVEIGLLYTRLGYQVKTFEMNKSYHQYSNELYYLGVPLVIRYAILERKRFGMFASQSVILEKGVASRSNTDTYTQGILSGSESSQAGIRGIQLSSLTGIGAEVNVSGNLSAYGQTGLQLFFMNGSQPYNIRSARMAWPSFQLGLRMKLK